MNFQRKLCTALGISFFVAAPLILMAYQEGPDARLTGAPGEDPAACASCHLGTGNPTIGSGVTVTFPNGLTYTPGVKQRLTVNVTPQTGSRPNGFELSIRLQSDVNVQAGDLTPTTDARTQIICQDNVSSKPCPPTFPVQFIEQTFQGSFGSSWTFDWTPPAANVGNIRVYVAGNAANGSGGNSGDRIYLNSYTLAPQASTPAPKLSATAPVLEAFQGGARLAPGAWIEIAGTNLAPSSKDWNDLIANNTAPTTINGTSVKVDGKSAFLSLASPELVKAQVPDGIGIGSLTVEVVTGGGSVSASANAAAVAPALLTSPVFNVGGVQYVQAVFADNATFVGRPNLIPGLNSRPAKIGEVIVVYAVGCGSAGVPAGSVTTGLPKITNVKVMFDQVLATTADAYLSPGSIGLCQFNIVVPNVQPGDHTISASINDVENGQGLKITIGQ